MSNIIEFPKTADFFLRESSRSLPELVEIDIRMATLVQRLEIHEDLFRLKLQSKVFLALAERSPESLVVTKDLPLGLTGHGLHGAFEARSIASPPQRQSTSPPKE